MRKTATIERCHCYGTPRFYFCLTYRGRVCSYWQTGHIVYCQTMADDLESLQAMKDHARKQGFTHVKFSGDWDKRTKPQGGKL